MNAKFRRVPLTIVKVEKHYVSHTDCVLAGLVIQPAARMRSSLLCGLFLSYIFPHYLISSTIFGGGNTWIRQGVFFIISAFVSNNSHSKSNRSSRRIFRKVFTMNYAVILVKDS